jgi:hypothetical protein
MDDDLDGIQLLPNSTEEAPEVFEVVITLTTRHPADLGPVVDAVENVVRVAPNVTGKVDGGEQYTRTFYGWDLRSDR